MNSILSVFVFALCFFDLHRPGHEEGIAQTLKYDIIRSGRVVGTMNASMIKNSTNVEYMTESKINMTLLVSVDVYNKVSGLFVDGVLQKGGITRRVNGNTKADVHLTLDKGKYLINEYGNVSSIQAVIRYSTACLMFIEPVNNKQVFSEVFKKFLVIKKISEHKYALQMPDGYQNIYTYKDGYCIEADVRSSVADLTIRLRK
ncbi:hypothetical protein DC498_09550 [Terrimonas sp.]|uniref:DUF6134 family protein n=1 Tax=Terrimonas sp. TaxID=1914338 RepID=UPI000D506A2C|nr:DUF6134 family protein [Terrimonas sp.]PVD52352.1 hypothetical protein DC498_09550 [Terrimonas sp.]